MGFAHRGLHYGTAFPENSLIAFAAALELGAGIECDLRLTADDAIVVFHDADARRLCASSMQIGKSTLAQLGRLSIGEHPIPTLESLFTLVGGRVPLLLEVKANDDIWRWMPALKRSLAGYDGPFGVMSFDPRVPRLLKTNLPAVRRGLVVRNDLPAWRRRIALSLGDPSFIAVDRAALGRPWIGRLRKRLPVYSWTIRTPAERETAEIYADALIWEGDGRPRS
jgi:glycerophosphoryl diester phosphodiesterase